MRLNDAVDAVTGEVFRDGWSRIRGSMQGLHVAKLRAPGWRGQGFQSDADNHSDLARTRFRGSRTRSRSPLPGC